MSSFSLNWSAESCRPLHMRLRSSPENSWSSSAFLSLPLEGEGISIYQSLCPSTLLSIIICFTSCTVLNQNPNHDDLRCRWTLPFWGPWTSVSIPLFFFSILLARMCLVPPYSRNHESERSVFVFLVWTHVMPWSSIGWACEEKLSQAYSFECYSSASRESFVFIRSKAFFFVLTGGCPSLDGSTLARWIFHGMTLL